MIDYAALDALAAELMAGRKAHLEREKGFIYRHGKRVAAGVIALRRLQTDDAGHDDALRVAAMFHDVGKGVGPHARTGAAIAREVLAPTLPPDLLDEVARLIRAHDDRAHAADLWVKLHQDADLIDHFGTIDIGMVFQYEEHAGGRGMEGALSFFQGEFEKNVRRYRPMLHHASAIAIFDERIAYERAFAKRLAVELAGGYVGFDDIRH